jgi:Ca2+-binding EF-hand superfamily protein
VKEDFYGSDEQLATRPVTYIVHSNAKFNRNPFSGFWYKIYKEMDTREASNYVSFMEFVQVTSKY